MSCEGEPTCCAKPLPSPSLPRRCVWLTLQSPAARPLLSDVNQSAPDGAQPDARALREFYVEVLRYVSLQRRIRQEAGGADLAAGARKDASSADALAIAIQRARPVGAKGDFFDARAMEHIRQRMRGAAADADVAAFLAATRDEPGYKKMPSVYMRFPVGSAVPAMPGPLLHVVPWLPRELEFRFLGEHLTLRDRHASVVLDYIPHLLRLPAAVMPAVGVKEPVR